MRWMAGCFLALILIGCGGTPAIDVSKIDTESILREDDLPAGYTWTSGDGDTSKIDPKPDKFAARSVEFRDGVSGNVSILVYADAAQATTFYDKARKGDVLSIGDRSMVDSQETSGTKQVTYSFQRCSTVVRATFLDIMVAIPAQRDIEAMLNAIDERLRNGPACGK